jgi:microcystin degradation protein MlrC
MAFRIALLGIFHESNTFLDQPTTIADFGNGHWLTGPDIAKEYGTAHHEIGGMMEVLDQEDIACIPAMYAEATPGGMVTAEAYGLLLGQMMRELDKIWPVDGCLVVPHGAAVSETYRDMDGHWLSLLREKLGKGKPIIGTLDPHANVSPLMVSSSDALIAYKTNPHIDQRQTGREAARLMISFLRGTVKPVQVLVQIPLAISIEQQYTGNDPCKSLYSFADELSRQPGILSVSILLGFPYADVQEMGSAVIVVSDNRRDEALSMAGKLERYVIDHRKDFVGEKMDITASLSLLAHSPGPVLMLDMGDNIGGGAPGNSMFLLDALEGYGKCRYFICLYAPQMVVHAARHRIGDLCDISISPSEDAPNSRTIRVRVLQLTDGKFSEPDARHGGQANYDMGEIAIVSTNNGSVIMFMSFRIPPFSLRQLTSFGILPDGFDVLVAKGVNAPIAAYAPVCPTIIKVDTPGITRADMTLFKYRNRRKPLFPFENLP